MYLGHTRPLIQASLYLIVYLLHGLGEVGLQLVVGVRGLVDALLEGRVGVVPRAPHVIGALCHHVVHVRPQTL